MSKSAQRLARYLGQAGKLLKQPAKALLLARRAGVKMEGSGERLDQVRQELATMVAMLKAWAAGDYQGVSRSALLSIAAGVLYFVSPLDAIPDFLLGVGFVDDIAVIGYIVKQVRSELAAFTQWQAAQVTAESVEQNVEQQPRRIHDKQDRD